MQIDDYPTICLHSRFELNNRTFLVYVIVTYTQTTACVFSLLVSIPHVIVHLFIVHGIVHLTTAPFYPATNGQAERFVQTMKKALTATRGEGESLQLKLSRFLLAYRNAPHATLNESLAMLFVKRH